MEKKKLNDDIKNYSTSLFSSNNAKCSSYETQYKLSQGYGENTSLFKEGLNKTVADAALQLKSPQKEAFDKLLTNDPDLLALKILDKCKGITRDPKDQNIIWKDSFPKFNEESQLASVLVELPGIPSETSRGPIIPLDRR